MSERPKVYESETVQRPTTLAKNMSVDKMSYVSYSQYKAKAKANSGHNGIVSGTYQNVDPSVNGNTLGRSNINLNIVVPNLENNGLQSQAQAQAQAQEQYCGGNDCNDVCCKPKKVKCKKYTCKEVCICKPKKCKYEYVLEENPKKKCYDDKKYEYCASDSSWFFESSHHKKGCGC